MVIKRVVVAGTFDGFHPGHESFLKQARQLGDELFVVVARDETVARHKGHRPALAEGDRVAAVQSHPLVDQAVLGSLGNEYLAVIVPLEPAVLALGYDQWPVEADLRWQLDQCGLGTTELVRLKPFSPEQYHSSFLQRRS